MLNNLIALIASVAQLDAQSGLVLVSILLAVVLLVKALKE